MKTSLLIFSLLFFGGCFNTVVQDSLNQPELLETYQLPTIPQSIYKPDFILNSEMLIDEQGNVAYAKILNSSGDRIWDSLAVKSLEKWRFSPAHYDHTPVKTLIRRRIVVHFDNPVYMNLAEILCTTPEISDSAYQALLRGENFQDVFNKYCDTDSKQKAGILGNTDINCYPEPVREQLANLSINNFTKPIQYGDKYVIFKRLQMIN